MLGLGFYIHKLLSVISSLTGHLRFFWEDMQQEYWEKQSVTWEQWWTMASAYAFGNINTNWEALSANWEDMVELPFWETSHTNWENSITNYEKIK